MTDTILNIRTTVRDRLEEASPRFWSNAELNRYLFEAAKWIARKAECLADTYPINVVPSVAKYALPFDGLRVHRMDFTPQGQQTQIYPLKPSTLYEADSVWGTFQQQQSSYPELFVIFGYPPGVAANTVAPNASTNAYWQVQLFPVPAQAGTLGVFYYRVPKALTGSDSDVLEIPNGWEDALVSYCEYVALRKDKDPMWQSAKQEFEEKVEDLIDKSQVLHDQPTSWQFDTARVGRSWLYGDDGDWY